MNLRNIKKSLLVMAFTGMLIGNPLPVLAAETGIDLDCENYASQLIKELSGAGLLIEGGAKQAKTISTDMCSATEETIQEQHEVAKQKAIDDWFFQSTGKKAGNKRLKKFKH